MDPWMAFPPYLCLCITLHVLVRGSIFEDSLFLGCWGLGLYCQTQSQVLSLCGSVKFSSVDAVGTSTEEGQTRKSGDSCSEFFGLLRCVSWVGPPCLFRTWPWGAALIRPSKIFKAKLLEENPPPSVVLDLLALGFHFPSQFQMAKYYAEWPHLSPYPLGLCLRSVYFLLSSVLCLKTLGWKPENKPECWAQTPAERHRLQPSLDHDDHVWEASQ